MKRALERQDILAEVRVCDATLVLHCCYTVVTLLLHCCYTVATLWSHCCYHEACVGAPRHPRPGARVCNCVTITNSMTITYYVFTTDG
jgi:hypothetical protein